jgi:hypothetical protein
MNDNLDEDPADISLRAQRAANPDSKLVTPDDAQLDARALRPVSCERPGMPYVSDS